MANLYKLTGDVVELQGICLNEELDLTEDEFQQLLEASFSTYTDLSEKFTAYGRLIKNLDAEAEALKREKQILASRQSAIENKVDRLKVALHQSMSITGTTKVEGIPSIMIARNPPSIDREKTDMGKVPSEFLNPPAEPTLNAKKAMDHFKETGEAPDGVVIVTNRTSVRIK